MSRLWRVLFPRPPVTTSALDQTPKPSLTAHIPTTVLSPSPLHHSSGRPEATVPRTAEAVAFSRHCRHRSTTAQGSAFQNEPPRWRGTLCHLPAPLPLLFFPSFSKTPLTPSPLLSRALPSGRLQPSKYASSILALSLICTVTTRRDTAASNPTTVVRSSKGYTKRPASQEGF